MAPGMYALRMYLNRHIHMYAGACARGVQTNIETRRASINSEPLSLVFPNTVHRARIIVYVYIPGTTTVTRIKADTFFMIIEYYRKK